MLKSVFPYILEAHITESLEWNEWQLKAILCDIMLDELESAGCEYSAVVPDIEGTFMIRIISPDSSSFDVYGRGKSRFESIKNGCVLIAGKHS